MTPEQERQFENMKKEIAELKQWKEKKTRQQVDYPLDIESQKALNNYYLPLKGQGYILNTTASADYATGVIKTEINAKEVLIPYDYYLKKCYVDTSTNIVYSDNHGLSNDQQVYFLSSGSIAGGLDTIVSLYVISSATNSFQVSTTVGGLAVDITSTGTGDQYVSVVQ